MKASSPVPARTPTLARGFSLVEIAIALIIVGLVFGAALTLLPGQLVGQRTKATEVIIKEARDAILGFAATNGRVPCPASANSHGYESFCSNASGACGAEIFGAGTSPPSHGRCAIFASGSASAGLLPSLTLGQAGTLNDGVATDDWSGTTVNRLRYAVTNGNIGPSTAGWTPETARTSTTFFPFSAPIDSNTGRTGLQDVAYNAGLNSLDAINGQFGAQLTVCNTASGVSGDDCADANATIAAAAVAVIYSVGSNAGQGGSGADEAQNPNPNGGSNDRVFVWHSPTEGNSPNGEFDDLLIWLSGPELYNRLITVGQLP